MGAEQAKIFGIGTINRVSMPLVSNNSASHKYVVTFLHLVKNTVGTTPSLALTLYSGGHTVRLLPVNFQFFDQSYALDVLEGYQNITLRNGDYILATTDTLNAIDYVVSGEVHLVTKDDA